MPSTPRYRALLVPGRENCPPAPAAFLAHLPFLLLPTPGPLPRDRKHATSGTPSPARFLLRSTVGGRRLSRQFSQPLHPGHYGCENESRRLRRRVRRPVWPDIVVASCLGLDSRPVQRPTVGGAEVGLARGLIGAACPPTNGGSSRARPPHPTTSEDSPDTDDREVEGL